MPRYLFLWNDESVTDEEGNALDVSLGIGEGPNPQDAFTAFENANKWVSDYAIYTDDITYVEIVGNPDNLSVEYNADHWAHVGGENP